MRRGRPPSYDRAQVLAALADSFLTHGLHGVSIDELSAASGLHRPSLRAAFGDRQDMYVEALDRLRQDLSAALTALFATPAPLGQHLSAFYNAALRTYLDGEHGPTGCLAICTATVEAYGDPVIRKRLAGLISLIDEALAARFARAIEDGELASTIDPQALGRLAGALLHSLAVRARAGETRAALERMATNAVALLTSSPVVPNSRDGSSAG